METIPKKVLTSVLIIGCIVLPGLTLAQGTSSAGQELGFDLIERANTLAGFASRAWIIPANVAGHLMTNGIVYGSAFYLDVYLFKFWQIMRTFSFYALGFIFIGSLLWVWFDPKDAKSKIAKLIKNTLIAGILISMSRRLIAALVDLSVIVTSAVAAIPQHIYAEQRQQSAGCYKIPKQLEVKQEKILNTNLLGNDEELKIIPWEDIVPEGNDLSGPLLFLGMGILKFSQMSFLPQQIDQNSSITDRSPMAIISLIKILLVFMFFIPLVVLMIINLIRVVLLRLRIIFSPIIVLDTVFGGPLAKKIENVFDWKQIIALIFQPAAVVGVLGIGLILIIEISKVLSTCTDTATTGSVNVIFDNASQSAVISDPSSTITPEIDIMASIYGLGDYVGGLIGELILAFFVIFLLRALIKVGFTFSKIANKTSSAIFTTAEAWGKAAPILPFGASIGAVQQAANKDDMFGLGRALDTRKRRQSDRLTTMIFGDQGSTLSEVEKGQIEHKAKNSSTTLTNRRSLLHEKARTKQFEQKYIKDIFQQWLTAGNGQAHMKQAGIGLSQPYTSDKINELRTNTKDSATVHKLINSIFTQESPKNSTQLVDIHKNASSTLQLSYGGQGGSSGQ